MTNDVAPISSSIALATVVLPMPGPPDNIKLGMCLSSTNSLKVFFKWSGRTHSLIDLGLCFSTHKKVSII